MPIADHRDIQNFAPTQTGDCLPHRAATLGIVLYHNAKELFYEKILIAS